MIKSVHKTLALFTLGILLTSCSHIRDVVLCQMHIGPTSFDESYASCAENNKQWNAKIEELNKFYLMSEASVRSIADKLQRCEQDNHGMKILGDMSFEICQLDIIDFNLSVGHCANGNETYDKTLHELNNYYATDEAGLNKIKERLISCDQVILVRSVY